LSFSHPGNFLRARSRPPAHCLYLCCPQPHENFIASLEQEGWRRSTFDDSHWSPAIQVDPFDVRLSAKPTFPVQVTEGQRPVNITAYPGESGKEKEQ
jgi:hypothetical protein